MADFVRNSLGDIALFHGSRDPVGSIFFSGADFDATILENDLIVASITSSGDHGTYSVSSPWFQIVDGTRSAMWAKWAGASESSASNSVTTPSGQEVAILAFILRGVDPTGTVLATGTNIRPFAQGGVNQSLASPSLQTSETGAVYIVSGGSSTVTVIDETSGDITDFVRYRNHTNGDGRPTYLGAAFDIAPNVNYTRTISFPSSTNSSGEVVAAILSALPPSSHSANVSFIGSVPTFAATVELQPEVEQAAFTAPAAQFNVTAEKQTDASVAIASGSAQFSVAASPTSVVSITNTTSSAVFAVTGAVESSAAVAVGITPQFSVTATPTSDAVIGWQSPSPQFSVAADLELGDAELSIAWTSPAASFSVMGSVESSASVTASITPTFSVVGSTTSSLSAAWSSGAATFSATSSVANEVSAGFSSPAPTFNAEADLQFLTTFHVSAPSAVFYAEAEVESSIAFATSVSPVFSVSAGVNENQSTELSVGWVVNLGQPFGVSATIVSEGVVGVTAPSAAFSAAMSMASQVDASFSVAPVFSASLKSESAIAINQSAPGAQFSATASVASTASAGFAVTPIFNVTAAKSSSISAGFVAPTPIFYMQTTGVPVDLECQWVAPSVTFVAYDSSPMANIGNAEELIKVLIANGLGADGTQYDPNFDGIVRCLQSLPSGEASAFPPTWDGLLDALADIGYGDGSEVHNGSYRGVIEAITGSDSTYDPNWMGLVTAFGLVSPNSLEDYIIEKFPFAHEAVVESLVSSISQAATLTGYTDRSIVDALASNNYLWLFTYGQAYNHDNGTGLAAVGDSIGSVRCIKTGELLVAPAVNNEPTLTASDGCDFITDDFFNLPISTSGWTAAEANLVFRVDSDPTVNGAGGHLWHFGSASGVGTHFPFTASVFDAFGLGTGMSASDRVTFDPTPSLSSDFRLYNRQAASGTNGHKGILDGVLQQERTVVTTGFPATPQIGKQIASAYFHGNVRALILKNTIDDYHGRTKIKHFGRLHFSLPGIPAPTLEEYALAKLQWLNPSLASSVAAAATAAATAIGGGRTAQQVLASLGESDYFTLEIEGQCYTNIAGTTLAVPTNAVGSVRCAKTGVLFVSEATRFPTLTASDGLQFQSAGGGDVLRYPNLSSWSTDRFEALLVQSIRGNSVPVYAINNSSEFGGTDTQQTFWRYESTGNVFEAFGRPSRTRPGQNAAFPSGITSDVWHLYNPRNAFNPLVGFNEHFEYVNRNLVNPGHVIDGTEPPGTPIPNGGAIVSSFSSSPAQGYMWASNNTRQYGTFNHRAIILKRSGYTAVQRGDIEQWLKSFFSLTGY